MVLLSLFWATGILYGYVTYERGSAFVSDRQSLITAVAVVPGTRYMALLHIWCICMHSGTWVLIIEWLSRVRICMILSALRANVEYWIQQCITKSPLQDSLVPGVEYRGYVLTRAVDTQQSVKCPRVLLEYSSLTTAIDAQQSVSHPGVIPPWVRV